ncbi:MAG: BON domain-containing protein [Pirellulales bacterium]|nr:BON domain-containing protein [Pirellulales bacterium]
MNWFLRAGLFDDSTANKATSRGEAKPGSWACFSLLYPGSSIVVMSSATAPSFEETTAGSCGEVGVGSKLRPRRTKDNSERTLLTPSTDEGCCSLQLARDAISQCSHLQGLQIQIDAPNTTDGSNVEVVLNGEVDSYFQKQLAQEAVLRLPEISEMSNRLYVRDCKPPRKAIRVCHA